MQITEWRFSSGLVIEPVGRVDSTTSSELEQRLQQAFGAGDRQLVVDFGKVDYISSAGLRVMLGALKKLRDGKGTLVLCALSEPVRQVFELAGFMPLFVVEQTRDKALARLTA